MPKPISQKTKEARALVEKLRDLLDAKENVAWHEAELWYELKKDGLYKFAFGDSGEASNKHSWLGFVREMGVPLATVDSKVKNYEFWVLTHRIPIKTLKTINSRKLHRAIPYVERGSFSVIDTLEQAKALPYDQFFLWLNGNEEPCHHPKDKRVMEAKEVVRCSVCKKEIHKH